MATEIYLQGVRRIVEIPEGVAPSAPVSLVVGKFRTDYAYTGDSHEGRRVYRAVGTWPIEPTPIPTNTRTATRKPAAKKAPTKAAPPKGRGSGRKTTKAVGVPPTFSG